MSVKDEINNATSSPADLTVTDNWAVGKWGCGNDVVYSSKISTNFSRPIDSSNMTISFRYRSGGDYPRLVLRWSDNASSTSTWTLGNNYTNFDGLPGVWGNYPFDFPFDSTWRQATLVINQAQHYWSIYVDGQEKFHQPFADFMPLARSLSVYTTNGPSVIDELAIWDRALPQAEILAINNFNAPFWPLVGREAPLAPVLTHAWHFDEGTGVANDSVGTAAITIPDGAWSYSGKVNHSVSILWSKDLTLSFAPLNNSKDLSFAFWYQAREYPNEGRIRFALRKGNQELMSLIPSVYRTKYVFNGREEIWSESLNNFLPYDDAWHHLAMTYDSYNYVLRVYIDGKEMASSSQIWLKDGTAPDNLLIKEENGSANIDELGLWQGALSTMQIKDIYDREK